MSKGALGLLSAYWPEDTPRYAHIPLKAVTDVSIHAVAKEAAGRPALITAGGALTYGELSEKVHAFAAALRNRCERGARVAITLTDPGELLVAALGAFQAEVLAFLSAGAPPAEALAAFTPALIVGSGELAQIGSIRLASLIAVPGKQPSVRPDLRTPILALARPDRQGEVVHNHRTLLATAIAIAGFFMIAEDTRVVLLEPPTAWHTLALLLGTLYRGATAWAAWGDHPALLPDRADYLVCSWERANKFLGPVEKLSARIGAGAIVAIEGPFSVSRRRRLARRLGTAVLTMLGRNDLGPVIASHPTWFLDDAAGIPLPNVDTRPLNPSQRTPLSIGWDSVERAELGVRSALAPAGGAIVEGWLQTAITAEVDPTGLYFLYQAAATLRPL